MNTIEDRLQELRHTVRLPAQPGLPPVDELAARATRRRRRHRRRALAVAGAVVVAMLVPAVLVARQDDPPDARVGSESPPQPGPTETTPLPVSGIPVALLATNHRDGSIVVDDLDAGVRARYADGQHELDFKTPEQLRTGSAGILAAALTADGELVAGVMPGPLVVFAPGQSLSEPGRQLPGTANWRAFLPTTSGDALWVVSGAGDLALIDMASGDVLQSVDGVHANTLVGVTGDRALVQEAYDDRGRVRMVSPSGDSTLLEPPPGAVDPGATVSFVGADTTRSVWLVDQRQMPPGVSSQGLGQTVLIVGPGGDTNWVPLLADDGSIWTWQGSQIGHGAMRTLTADGSRLLLNIAAPGNTIPTQLVVVDLVTGTARAVYEGEAVEAFWAADDRTAIVMDIGDADTKIAAVDIESGTVTMVDHLDPGSEVRAAG